MSMVKDARVLLVGGELQVRLDGVSVFATSMKVEGCEVRLYRRDEIVGFATIEGDYRSVVVDEFVYYMREHDGADTVTFKPVRISEQDQ